MRKRDERSREQRRFDAATERARKLVRGLARDEVTLDRVSRAITAAYEAARFADDPSAANRDVDAIQRSVGPASEEARAARIRALEEQAARLREEIREARPRPGTYEHELALMRGGRR